MSKLDSHMLKYNSNNDLKEFIKNIIIDDYSNEYYTEYHYEIKEINKFILIALAYV